MSAEQLSQNVEALVAGIATELPRSWGNIRRVQLHATRGRRFVVYTAPRKLRQAVVVQEDVADEKQDGRYYYSAQRAF
jgi:hypothetical protein